MTAGGGRRGGGCLNCTLHLFHVRLPSTAPPGATHIPPISLLVASRSLLSSVTPLKKKKNALSLSFIASLRLWMSFCLHRFFFPKAVSLSLFEALHIHIYIYTYILYFSGSRSSVMRGSLCDLSVTMRPDDGGGVSL